MCFASHSVSNMLRRVLRSRLCCDYKTFQQTAQMVNTLRAIEINALTNDAQAELDSSGEKSDVDSPSKDDDSDLQNQVQVNQNLIGKDGTA